MNESIVGSDQKLRANVHGALRKLPKRSREAITFRVFNGLSSKEIGIRMKTSPRAVDLLIFRAKSRLRRLLSHYAQD
jgi:DNA-directed RNA polymerase specialized sigma24 family protein